MDSALLDNSKTKLMLVDDDPAIVRLLTKIIGRSFENDMELRSLTDALAARECIDLHRIDILVTDLDMPGIDGLELLRHAKQRNVLTQVIFMTGNSTVHALTSALEWGATDYLVKPLDQTELLELLGQAQYRVQRWRQALAETFQAGRTRLPVTGDHTCDPSSAGRDV